MKVYELMNEIMEESLPLESRVLGYLEFKIYQDFGIEVEEGYFVKALREAYDVLEQELSEEQAMLTRAEMLMFRVQRMLEEMK